jgi:hypothetical protein
MDLAMPRELPSQCFQESKAGCFNDLPCLKKAPKAGGGWPAKFYRPEQAIDGTAVLSIELRYCSVFLY